MSLAVDAWRLRQSARQAILEGDPERSRAFAAEAQHLCQTPAGRRLEALSAWLAAHPQQKVRSTVRPVTLTGPIDSAIGAFDQMALFAWPFEAP